MIQRLVLFGATGDLAGRFLFPALAALFAGGHLPLAVGSSSRAHVADVRDTIRVRVPPDRMRPTPTDELS